MAESLSLSLTPLLLECLECLLVITLGSFSPPPCSLTFPPPQLEQLLQRLIEHEVAVTADPNTLFRGNTLVTKMVDEFMKLIGLPYLHRTLQGCIDEVSTS